MSRIDPGTELALRRFLDLVAQRYDIAGALLYGSRARGTHHLDSDADLAVLLRGAPARLQTAKLDMADTAFDVLLETGIHISPLPLWLEQWQQPDTYPNPALLRNIEREGVWL